MFEQVNVLLRKSFRPASNGITYRYVAPKTVPGITEGPEDGLSDRDGLEEGCELNEGFSLFDGIKVGIFDKLGFFDTVGLVDAVLDGSKLGLSDGILVGFLVFLGFLGDHNFFFHNDDWSVCRVGGGVRTKREGLR